LNQIQLTSITPSGIDALPMAFFMSFNVYDQDQMGLFGARNPRASTIFGPCIQVSATQFTSVAYALQPVKVFAPKTRIKLEWSNNNTFTTNALGFEMFLDGIEVLGYDMPDDGNTEELRDLVEELLEKRVR
jgi:hypothetical protein